MLNVKCWIPPVCIMCAAGQVLVGNWATGLGRSCWFSKTSHRENIRPKSKYKTKKLKSRIGPLPGLVAHFGFPKLASTATKRDRTSDHTRWKIGNGKKQNKLEVYCKM